MSCRVCMFLDRRKLRMEKEYGYEKAIHTRDIHAMLSSLCLFVMIAPRGRRGALGLDHFWRERMVGVFSVVSEIMLMPPLLHLCLVLFFHFSFFLHVTWV